MLDFMQVLSHYGQFWDSLAIRTPTCVWLLMGNTGEILVNSKVFVCLSQLWKTHSSLLIVKTVFTIMSPRSRTNM